MFGGIHRDNVGWLIKKSTSEPMYSCYVAACGLRLTSRAVTAHHLDGSLRVGAPRVRELPLGPLCSASLHRT